MELVSVSMPLHFTTLTHDLKRNIKNKEEIKRRCELFFENIAEIFEMAQELCFRFILLCNHKSHHSKISNIETVYAF